MRTPVLLALALALAACKQSPPGKCSGNDACGVGQECAGGVCVRFDTDHQLGSRCIRDGDCVAWGRCAGEVCALAPGRCVDGSGCEPNWQRCSFETFTCVTVAGFCGGPAECLPWQVCSAGHLCENGPGYCATGAECGAWQTCSSLHACVTAPGYCGGPADCAAWQDCAGDHRCATKAGRCATTNDCPAWDLCDATHTCAHQAWYCGGDQDCTAPETCSAYHVCSNQASGRLKWLKRIGSDDPAAMAEQDTWAYQIACLGGGDLVASVYAGGPVDPGDGVLRSGHLVVSFASADGAVQWVSTVQANPQIEPAPGGDFVMVGTGAGDDLGGGPLPRNWIARLAADRTVRWQGARPVDPMSPGAVAVSSTGEIVLAGASWTGSGNTLVAWPVVTKLDASGLTTVWTVRPLDDAPGALLTNAAFTPDGDVVVAATRYVISAGGTVRAISVTLLDGATGARLWKQEYGTDAQGRPTIPATPRSLAVAADGTIMLVGNVVVDMSFGGDLLDVTTGDEAFVLKLASNGDYLWHVQAKGHTSDSSHSYPHGAQLPDGTVYLEALYSTIVDVGGKLAGDSGVYGGAMLARIDPSGVVSSVSTYPVTWLYDRDPFGGTELGMSEMCAGNGHLGWLENRHGRLVIEGVPSLSGRVVDAFIGKLAP